MNKRILLILGHIAGWSILAIVLYQFYPIGDLSKEVSENGQKPYYITHPYAPFVLTFVSMLFFYGNDKFLFPKLFLNTGVKKNRYYLSLILLLGFVAALQYLTDWIFTQNLELTERAKERGALGYFVDPIGFTLTGMLFISTFFFSIGVSFFKSWKQEEEFKKQLAEEKIKTENQLLRAQVNPHFLFNVLNAFFSLAQKHNAPEIEEGVVTLSEMFRYALNSEQSSKISMKKEIEYLKSYLFLQKLRFEEQNQIKISFKAEGNFNEVKIHQLLLITFIENAFKHSTAVDKNSFIDIHIKIDDTKLLELMVSNSVGAVNQNDESFGYGLKNVKKRLDILYPDSYSLFQYTQKQVFYTELSINLN